MKSRPEDPTKTVLGVNGKLSGTTNDSMQNADFNNLNGTMFFWASGASNVPNDISLPYGLQFDAGYGRKIQFVCSLGSSKIYFRTYKFDESIWSAWKEL